MYVKGICEVYTVDISLKMKVYFTFHAVMGKWMTLVSSGGGRYRATCLGTQPSEGAVMAAAMVSAAGKIELDVNEIPY